MKFLFDIFPVILFFIAFKAFDIYVATAVAIAATFVQLGWAWLRHRKIDNMLWVTLGVIVVFGGATLLLQDETFIKWKPTVLYWLFGVTLTVAWLGFRKNLIRSMMQQQMSLPDFVWQRLQASWIAFFVIMGALNLFVAYTFSTDAWVNFKLFGGIGLMLVFVFLQALMLARHVEDKGPDQARTDCTLELLDYDGSAIATYSIQQAWPVKYTGVSMNAGSNEVAVEGITLAHEGFKRM